MKAGILLLLGIATVVFISGCTQLGQVISSLNLTCEDSARKLFPDNITLYDSEVFGVELSLAKDLRWKDGSPITLNYYDSAGFRNAQNKGENVNYYYFMPYNLNIPHFESNCMTYSKIIIDKDGKILGTRKFEISPTVELIPNTTFLYKPMGMGLEFNAQIFRIVNAEFCSCEWVE